MSSLYYSSTQPITKTFSGFTKEDFGTSVFKINLLEYYDRIPTLILLLNQEEATRAKSYRFLKDKNSFIIRRALLKYLLSKRTGLSIAEIQLMEDENKKPFLPSNNELFFNVSHSKALAVITISNVAIGIDVEYLNQQFDFSDILTHSFDASEIEQITQASNKAYTFFKFWTRKEAIIKATGQGITDHLLKMNVTDGSREIDDNYLNKFNKLFITSFDIENDYIAAIAKNKSPMTEKELVINEITITHDELISLTGS